MHEKANPFERTETQSFRSKEKIYDSGAANPASQSATAFSDKFNFLFLAPLRTLWMQDERTT